MEDVLHRLTCLEEAHKEDMKAVREETGKVRADLEGENDRLRAELKVVKRDLEECRAQLCLDENELV
ncbi:hypothetical protein BDZ85DRAFT_279044 [Elsinoe ampelina]|uniref:Uncharacterized protein n=1 Tax=Elsinoe ampelina TaxID=302913 RepID=A0A6A6GNT7_9PEZI|nr:hypothetical protein BDZ85DRAFT_279044 [Elsinoe ampelina]